MQSVNEEHNRRPTIEAYLAPARRTASSEANEGIPLTIHKRSWYVLMRQSVGEEQSAKIHVQSIHHGAALNPPLHSMLPERFGSVNFLLDDMNVYEKTQENPRQCFIVDGAFAYWHLTPRPNPVHFDSSQTWADMSWRFQIAVPRDIWT